MDMVNFTVERFKVSHGSGKINGISHGDPDHIGELKKCIHKRSIHRSAGKHSRYAMTRPGFFLTGKQYLSGGSHIEVRNSRTGVLTRGWPYLTRAKQTNGLKLIGLSLGINDGAMRNGVVMHGAWYNEAPLFGHQ